MTTLFAPAPALLRPTDIKLRPYQDEAIDRIRHEFSGGKRATLLILPTGCGKTVTFGYVARKTALNGGRTLVLAHRGELVEQAAESLSRIGLEVGIEKADQYARAMGDPHAVIATVQTMQRARLESWPADYFKLIITDEAHHATADTYRRIYRHFKARHLGVTATADRADETFLGDVYESVAYELSLWDAMTAPAPGPYLSRVRFVQCDTGVDLRDIRTTGGDFNQADLEEAIRPHIEALANAIRQEVSGRKTIVFTPDVGSAMAMASALESIGIPARWVSGDSKDRKQTIQEFKDNQFQALCNCALLTEGFDCLDEETEVLTCDGWKGVDDVSLDDTLYTLNRETGKIEVASILRKVARPLNDGERMVMFKGQHVNIRTTEGHEFHIKYRDPAKGGALSRNWLTKNGAQMVERRSTYALPISAEYEAGYPGVPLTDDEIRLVAWFMTDGGFERQALTINQSKGYQDEIRDLLDRIGVDFRERVRVRDTNFTDNSTIHEFSVPKGTHTGELTRKGWNRYESYLDKNVAPALNLMDRRQFLVFWGELLKGDGSLQPGKSGWLWCDRKSQVDAYMKMAILRGLSASYAEEVTSSGNIVYRVSVRDAQWLTSDPADSRAASIQFDEPRPGETVWCLTNRNGTLITRRHGKVAIIGNCPDVAAIALCRPTKSRPLYAQMVGRGTRLAPGKTDCLLIDFAWLTSKHDLVKPIELFDSTQQDAEVLEIAQSLLEKNPGTDLTEAVEQAREEHEKRAVIRIKAREREMKYRRVSYDPLSAMEVLGVPVRKSAANSMMGTATERQREYLKGFGVSNVDNISKPMAGRLLDRLKDRRAKNLASVKQVSWLIRLGVEPGQARAMTKDEAGAYLTSRWGPMKKKAH